MKLKEKIYRIISDNFPNDKDPECAFDISKAVNEINYFIKKYLIVLSAFFLLVIVAVILFYYFLMPLL
jgi:hypothetical protein